MPLYPQLGDGVELPGDTAIVNEWEGEPMASEGSVDGQRSDCKSSNSVFFSIRTTMQQETG